MPNACGAQTSSPARGVPVVLSCVADLEVDLVLAVPRRMNVITWLVVKLVAGGSASTVVPGSGVGRLGNIVLGIAGGATVRP